MIVISESVHKLYFLLIVMEVEHRILEILRWIMAQNIIDLKTRISNPS